MRRLPISVVLITVSLGTLPLVAQARPAPRMPLHFEPCETPGWFLARDGAITWGLSGGRLLASTPVGEVSLEVVGAQPNARLDGEQRARSHSNYYLGNRPERWRTDVPHFRELRAREVLPGVDLVHHACERHLEFDFVVAPGVARDLRLRVSGALPRLASDGGITMALGEDRRGQGDGPIGDSVLELGAPKVWQQLRGERIAVPCHYALDGDEVVFVLGGHDATLPLTIDPVVRFATMLGGALGADKLKGVHIDQQDNLLVTGLTDASDFPILGGLGYPYRFDIGFVSKFDPNGDLVFSTFFGGTSGVCAPVDVGADPDGQIVIGGNTTSPDLPTTIGVVQPTLVGGGDWFFLDLDSAGALNWCTYYGGPGNQLNMKCLHVLDVQLGSVVGVGVEGSFPILPNAYSATGNLCVGGVFGGNVLWVSTTCGFTGQPTAVDVDDVGHICITGSISGTGSGLPTTGASFQPNPASPGGIDGFVFVFTGIQNSLVWATYFGGSGGDVPRAIRARSGAGTVNVTIAGNTTSVDLPVWSAIQPSRGAVQDGFVAQIDGLTQSLVFATYLGGSDPGESVSGVGVDAAGFVVVAGESSSADLPFRNAMQLATSFSNRDVMLYRLTPTGQLDCCTLFGGNGSDLLLDLAVTPGGEFAIGATTATNNFPSSTNALAPAFVDQDGFVARIDPRSMESYGASTPGYWSFRPVLAGGGPMAIGSTTRLQILNGRALSVGVLGVGFGRIHVPLWGGELLVNPLVLSTIVLNGSIATVQSTYGGGYLYTSFAIPNQPSAIGLVLDWQAALFDPAANSGVALTNAVELVVQ